MYRSIIILIFLSILSSCLNELKVIKPRISSGSYSKIKLTCDLNNDGECSIIDYEIMAKELMELIPSNSLLGDVNNDCKTDIRVDFKAFFQAFPDAGNLATKSFPHSTYDLDRNGIVNFIDVSILSGHYGDTFLFSDYNKDFVTDINDTNIMNTFNNTISCDLNGDTSCDLKDYLRFKAKYNMPLDLTGTSPAYDALDIDYNNDFVIDEKDVLIFLDVFQAYNESFLFVNNDWDGDGVLNDVDNCIFYSNPNQIDADGDYLGNYCDVDFNNDGIIDVDLDAAIHTSTFGTVDPIYDLNSSGGLINIIDFTIYLNQVLRATPPQAQYSCP